MMAKRILAVIIVPIALLVFAGCGRASAQQSVPEYYAPLANAKYVSKGTTVIVRYGPTLTTEDLKGIRFKVTGSKSGSHSGSEILADDHKTVIFKPSTEFTPGEQVHVEVSSFKSPSGTVFANLSYDVSISTHQEVGEVGSTQAATTTPRSAFPSFLTVPQDIPHFTVKASSTSISDEGDLFVAPFYWTKSTMGSYLLILNTKGQLVYYKSVADDLAAFDFKEQPNGLLSYYDQKDAVYYVMNSHYQVVNTYKAANGYAADLHDLQILPNGDALLMAYDKETVDMSQIVKGGKKDASVTGLVIQELDPSKNVIFQWRSWDHLPIQDTTVDLTAQDIDLVHGNALALANDGNLLLSSRNMSAIFKIDLNTGNILWQLGGKGNQFDITGQTFAFQHDVRQLPNGDITVFDNQGTTDDPAASHAIEYHLDLVNKTAKVVWEFTHNPPVFGTYMGNTERLSDGNTFISWGAPFVGKGYSYNNMTEVSPDGKVLFDLSFDQPYVSYRAFHEKWVGTPDTLPDLAAKVSGNDLTLGYSWNGATNVASYGLFAGDSTSSLALIQSPAKTDFETQSHFSNLASGTCYYQVAALDSSGKELARSKPISTNLACPNVHS